MSRAKKNSVRYRLRNGWYRGHSEHSVDLDIIVERTSATINRAYGCTPRATPSHTRPSCATTKRRGSGMFDIYTPIYYQLRPMPELFILPLTQLSHTENRVLI